MLSAQDTVQEGTSIAPIATVPSALKRGFSCPNGESLLINQLPNQSDGFLADSDCEQDFCGPTGQQSVADDFVLSDATTVAQLVLWGG